MTERHRRLLRLTALTVLALTFLTGHAFMLAGGLSRTSLPVAALASGMIVVAVAKHLGLLGSLWAFLRRRIF